MALALDEADSATPIRDMGVGEGLAAVTLSGEEVREGLEEVTLLGVEVEEGFDMVSHSGEEEEEGSDPEWTCSRAVDCEDLVDTVTQKRDRQSSSATDCVATLCRL